MDMSLFTGVEVINGGRIFLSSSDFWDNQLAKGAQLTAIGGSDNHNAPAKAGDPGAIGWPTTVVEASELSVPAILDGIRHGRVFIDLTASRSRVIDLDARIEKNNDSNPIDAHMGGTLLADKGDSIEFQAHVADCPRSGLHIFLDGKESADLEVLPTKSGDEDVPFRWTSDGGSHWLRVEVRDSNGSLVLISNPIYIQPAR